MNTIKVIEKAETMIHKLLFDHVDDIKKAYLKSGSELSIALSLKIEPTKDPGIVALDVGINFVESRIKDSGKVLINELQDELFKVAEKLRPAAYSSIDSVTISTPGGESVTLKKKEKKE